MYKISRILLFGLAVLLILMALVACGSAEDTPSPGSNAEGISVAITGSSCPSVEVGLNKQVTWTNDDKVNHQVRVAYSDGSPMVDLGELQPGGIASFTFTQAGSFPYTCSVDQQSTGTITVQP